ncbi:MAG: aldo/keto reductase [Dorea sp.]|jgi:Aldo/keto reductases, related to diketogulonate reductase|nr:aldo/keto reductase [Dorea sp.]
MKFFKTTTGLKIPQIGLGSFDLKADAICNAIQSGYTLIDTAWQYGNEKEVGKAIKKSGKSREDIIISTKLWTEDIRQNQIQKEFDESLRNLQTDYVDIYLIHWPAVGFERAWETMAMLKEKGKIKEIGVCNFTPLHFDKLAKVSGIIPILNQIESHPYYQNANLIKYCKDRGIMPQAWCPLGGSYSKLVDDDSFKAISRKYRKTSAQIILKWHLQRDIWIIPRSANKERQKDNINLFDFELETEDMEKINQMDTGNRIGPDPDNFNF